MSQALDDEKKKAFATTFILIKIGDSMFFTDCDKIINYGGDDYMPWRMQVPGIKKSDGTPVENMQIKLSAANLVIPAAILNGLFADQPVTVFEAWLNPDESILGVEDLYVGSVDGYPGLKEDWATIGVGPAVNWANKPCPCVKNSIENFPFLQDANTRITGFGSYITIIDPGG